MAEQFEEVYTYVSTQGDGPEIDAALARAKTALQEADLSGLEARVTQLEEAPEFPDLPDGGIPVGTPSGVTHLISTEDGRTLITSNKAQQREFLDIGDIDGVFGWRFPDDGTEDPEPDPGMEWVQLALTALQYGEAATPAQGALADTALQPGEAATPAQGALADTALQPSSIASESSSSGAIETPLDDSITTVTLTEDITDWTAPLPSGASEATTGYYATVVFFAPSSGTFTVTPPSGWKRLGGIETLEMGSGDEPIIVSLHSFGASLKTYTAVQAS